MSTDLDELEGLLREATPVPWLLTEVERPHRIGDAWSESGWSTEFVGFEILGQDDARVHSETDGVEDEANAAFIVAAVNALPDLIAAARERDGLREALDKADALLREHLGVFGAPNFTDRGGYANEIRDYFARQSLAPNAGEPK